MIRLRDEAASTSSPSLQLPSASRGEDRPEVTLPPRKRLDIALGPRYEVGESSSAAAARPARGFRVDYGFVATVDREIMRDPEREVGYGIIDSWDEIVETLRQTVISELLRIDHRRSTEISELRTALQGQELPVFPNGVKEWSLSFTSATALLKTKSSLLHALFTLLLRHGGAPISRPLVMKPLTVKGTDLASYTQRFQELALLCGRMFFEEADKIEKYVGGLPDMIHGSVVASKLKTMQEAIEIATEFIDKKIRTFAERETASKRKFENTSRNTQNQQHSNKRQNTGRVYTAASGHFRRECPKLKNNNNHGNQGGRNNAPARVYAVGRAGTDPDANVVTDTFPLNNRYAYILFDTGADRSFVSTTFSTQINIT
nr:hypothetical protein [Tanacetum cinerariifolium]